MTNRLNEILSEIRELEQSVQEELKSVITGNSFIIHGGVIRIPIRVTSMALQYLYLSA